MSRFRLFFAALSIVVLVFILIWTVGPACAVTKLILGTAGQGGTWYVLGSGIANLITKYNPDIKMTSASTRGTIENMRLVGTGRIDIGMTQPPADLWALKGVELYKGNPYPQLRFVCGGHYSVQHTVVAYDSPIKSIADLKGKRVAIGEPGSGTRHVCGRATLWAGGLDFEDITVVSLNQAQGADALVEGSVDAAHFSGGIPTPGLINLAMTKKVRILPIPPKDVEKLKKKYPSIAAAFKSIIVPAGTYRGQDEPLYTIGSITAFTTRADFPEDVIYRFIKTIFDHRDELEKIHKAGSEYTLEAMSSGCDIPPHPGASRFFKEKNVNLQVEGY
jgi:TRAP transporter TAXI family solute receptor